MDWYHVALFVHFIALVIAIAAASRVEFFFERRSKASTVRETLEWHRRLMATAKAFPIALVLLVLSGSYMVSTGTAQTWSAGFVTAGFTGVVLLLASGNFLSMKGRALARRLEQRIAGGEGENAPALPPALLPATLLRANFAIVVAVVFDMTLKPTIADALGVLALAVAAAVVGSAVAFSRRKASATTAGISQETQYPS